MKKIIRLTESDLIRLVKRVIKEEAEERVKISINTSHGVIVYIGELGRKPNEDLYYFKPEEGGFEFISDGDMKPNWKLEQRFNSMVGKHLPVDYEYGNHIKLGGIRNPGSMYITGLIHGEQNVRIEKI
jgi:hypothetical protein